MNGCVAGGLNKPGAFLAFGYGRQYGMRLV